MILLKYGEKEGRDYRVRKKGEGKEKVSEGR
jgi:hypothetical protein